MPPSVQAVFDTYPAKARQRLLDVRALILDIAAGDETIGPIEETLKWGEPAYLTSKTRSGTTIRLAWKPASPDTCSVYLNCQTTLVDTYRTVFPELTYEGNRAIVLDCRKRLPVKALRQCAAMALRYHRTRKR